MRRVALFFLLILFSAILHAKEYRYRVRSPLLGELGTIRVEQKISGSQYRIEGNATTKGIAAFLTGHRREAYLSEGTIVRGNHRSRHFRVERWMKKKHQIDDYRFDFAKRKILKRKLRWKKGCLDHNVSKALDYFSPVDLMALYPNVAAQTKGFCGPWSRSYLAAGAEKVKGRVVVRIPTAQEAEEIRREMHLPAGLGKIFVVGSAEKILGKRNRRLEMAIDAQGVLRKARLVALPVVGEIFVERVR